MMVYNTRDYWVFGLHPSCGILKNTTFRKLNLFPSLVYGVADPCSVDSVRNSYPQLLDLSLAKGPYRAGVSHPFT
jgi:hypothetical protein